MANLPNPGSDNEQWGSILNNFLLVAHNPDGTPANVVANVAGLKGLTAVASATVGTVYVKGYYATGDGGEGMFCWDAASTVADNGGTVIALTAGGTGRWKRQTGGAAVNVKWFGAKGDGVTDDIEAINAAIVFAEQASGAAVGAVVTFPTGTYPVSSTIHLPNRVGLQGVNGRGTTIKLHSTFSGLYLFHASNGTAAMFGSYLKDFYIDARGKTLTAVVYSQAWQETCGMERVLLQFEDSTTAGFLYSDGFGGAAYLPLKDIEIFSDSANANAVGIKVNQISLVGGFVLSVDGLTVAGSPQHPLPIGMEMSNDSLIVKGYHAEYCNAMVAMDGAGGISADTLTGSFNAVGDMVVISSTYTGVASLRNMIPNGAVGQIFRDNKTGRNIPASSGMLAQHIHQPSGFSASLSSQLGSATGNGLEYRIPFDTVIHDALGEFNSATGVFTVQRAGRYLLSVCLKLNLPAGSTSSIVRINTTLKTYEVFRGNFANIRDSGGNVTINGRVLADMNAGSIADVSVMVSGIGVDTVIILPSETVFSGQFVSR